MELEHPIGLGRTAEIYAWDEGQVLKLFRPGATLASAEHEARIARAVADTRLPVPRVGALVEINGRYGLVYERVSGVSLMEQLKTRPWRLSESARLLAGLHAAVHAWPAPELPALHERLERRIRAASMPGRLKVAALVTLKELPEGDSLCHGDFHPENVIITGRGPLIIDWPDASRGNPVADVARTSLLLKAGGLPPGTRMAALIQLSRGILLRTYLKRYRELRPVDIFYLHAWMGVCAAARLDEKIPEERARMLKLAQSYLSDRKQAL